MIVYHGTTETIEQPNVKYSKKYLDFGKGFYLTIFEEQAKKWAVRKRKMKSGWNSFVLVEGENH